MDQLKTRMKALQAEKEVIERELHQVIGAHRELTQYVQSQMVPGINHEKTDKRRQEMENLMGNLQARLQQCAGSLKETMYWIHQTPEGQQPKEAIEQLLEKTKADADGPVTPLDALVYHEDDLQIEIPAPVIEVNGDKQPTQKRRQKLAEVGEA